MAERWLVLAKTSQFKVSRISPGGGVQEFFFEQIPTGGPVVRLRNPESDDLLEIDAQSITRDPSGDSWIEAGAPVHLVDEETELDRVPLSVDDASHL